MRKAGGESLAGRKQASLRTRSAHSRLRDGLIRATTQPLHLILATLFAAVALAFGSWWPFLLGLLACTGHAVVTIFRPQFWRTLSSKLNTLHLADLTVKEPELQPLVAAFATGRTDIELALAETAEEVKQQLAPALSWLDELEEHAARLVLRAQSLTRYLETIRQGSLLYEVNQLSELAHHGDDADTRKDYESVLAWQREHLQLSLQVSQARDRAVAGLLKALVILKSFPVRIIGLQILHTELKDSVSADLTEEWNQIQEEFQSSEELLRGFPALPAQLDE